MYIYEYIHTHTCIYIYIYIHINQATLRSYAACSIALQVLIQTQVNCFFPPRNLPYSMATDLLAENLGLFNRSASVHQDAMGRLWLVGSIKL